MTRMFSWSRYVSVGANNNPYKANVPPAFVWRDPPSGKEALCLWHNLGYGVTSQAIKIYDRAFVSEIGCLWFQSIPTTGKGNE